MSRTLAPGRALTRPVFAPRGVCIACGLDAEGETLTTWTFVGPPRVESMCHWCLELWDARGWLA